MVIGVLNDARGCDAQLSYKISGCINTDYGNRVSGLKLRLLSFLIFRYQDGVWLTRTAIQASSSGSVNTLTGYCQAVQLRLQMNAFFMFMMALTKQKNIIGVPRG